MYVDYLSIINGEYGDVPKLRSATLDG